MLLGPKSAGSKTAANARFVAVRGSVLRLLCLTGFGTALAFGCSVFPDTAVLPLSEDAGAGPGEAGASTAGDASSAGVGPTAGAGNTSQGGSASGGSATGGAGASAGTGASGGSEPLGGAPDGGVGGTGGAMGGTAGAAGCVQRIHEVKVGADTWIDAAKPSTNHVSDKQIYVTGGAAERRLLLAFDLPAVSAGAKLNSAILQLKLQSNADATLVSRLLELHVVTQAVNDAQATWLNFGKGGARKWTVPGGDFGPVEAAQTVKAGISAGQVRFDVSQVVRPLLKNKSVPLDLLVAEGGIAPAAPAELAFVSLEGDAAAYPALTLDTCEP